MRERVMEWRGLCRVDPRPVDSDQEAVQAFLAGDSRAFDSLFERYHGYVYNICLGMTGRSEDAEDITQETFLRVHRALPSFRGAARFSTWLYRIAVNCSIEHLRRPNILFASEDISDLEPSGGEQVEEIVLRAGEREQVRRALTRVPISYRTVLTLRYLQDQSLEEMAQVLQCSTGAVKVRLHRARLAFRDAFLALERSEEDAMPARG